jgi:enamine deaminase RidA (YjgF/YER057c/UK114 family)
VQRLEGDPPSPWEGPFAFSRVVKAGRFVLVGGTTSVDPDGVVLGLSPYEQTLEILRKIEHELGRAGASIADVIQTRIYVTDISRSEEIGRAHGEIFGDVRPLMTMVGISALIDPRMLVEIEAVALL